MAIVSAWGSQPANLSAAQTGSAASTNIADVGRIQHLPVIVRITTTIGATPTCTYALEGSPDGTNWFPLPYADSATPLTIVSTTFVITTAVTVMKIVQATAMPRFLRISYSSNTNVTNTADLFA